MKTICTLEPISILFVQYEITIQQFADITGMDYDMASKLSVVSRELNGKDARNPLYDLITDEQRKRINDFFHVDLSKPNKKGECEMPFSAIPEVADKLSDL